MDRKCYEIKYCPCTDTDPSTSGCPPHMSQVGCWEYDWMAYYGDMPAGPGKEEWRRAMLDACPTCEVMKEHPEQMADWLERLRTVEGSVDASESA